MKGTGEATGVPDQLSFELSVDMEATDVSSGLHQADARMRRVLAGLTTADVQRKDVATTGLSIRPVYEYRDNAPAVITGYRSPRTPPCWSLRTAAQVGRSRPHRAPVATRYVCTG